ncbi:MAG: hypothetical protein EKK57_09010 [Proteobacteria bacterium]|nr:MAG: hypothetical protein EKK57_09010 [Pseudomonadota bacterium]
MLPNKTSQKKFFWLKLHHDFFNRDEIRIIESQPNGKDYIIFYLKLMLKAINDNGKLMFKDTIPYTPEMLASITNTSIDTVRVAIDAFVKLGLITLLDDGALFMQEVQKLVGSETPDAERKRVARAKQNSQPKLPRADKKRTLSGQSSEHVTLENKSIELKSKDNITPYIPQTDNSKYELGIVGVWLEHLKNLNCNFTETEISAISEFAKYKSEAGESVTSQQINLTLERLIEHKNAGYDISRMIRHSIASGYKAVMTPTKDFLVNGVVKPIVSGKYPAAEYITPESNQQKRELANYLESCYLRKLNPKTKSPLNSEELACIAKHRTRQSKSSPYIGWFDYIYQNEVLTGICLLDQNLDGIATVAKPVAA